MWHLAIGYHVSLWLLAGANVSAPPQPYGGTRLATDAPIAAAAAHGHQLAAIDVEGTLYVWDLSDKSKKVQRHGRVRSPGLRGRIFWDDRGDSLVLASLDGLWWYSPSRAKELGRFQPCGTALAGCSTVVVEGPEGLVLVSRDGKRSTLSRPTVPIRKFTVVGDRAVALTEAGSILYSAGAKWKRLSEFRDPVQDVASDWADSTTWLLANDGRLVAWDWAHNRPRWQVEVAKGKERLRIMRCSGKHPVVLAASAAEFRWTVLSPLDGRVVERGRCARLPAPPSVVLCGPQGHEPLVTLGSHIHPATDFARSSPPPCGHCYPVLWLTWAGEHTLLSASRYRLCAWDTRSKKPVLSLPIEPSGFPVRPAFDPRTGTVAIAWGSGSVRLVRFDAQRLRLESVIRAQEGKVVCAIAWLPQKKRQLAVGWYDQQRPVVRLSLYHVGPDQTSEVQSVSCVGPAPRSFAFGGPGRGIVVHHDGGALGRWNVDAQRSVFKWFSGRNASGDLSNAASIVFVTGMAVATTHVDLPYGDDARSLLPDELLGEIGVLSYVDVFELLPHGIKAQWAMVVDEAWRVESARMEGTTLRLLLSNGRKLRLLRATTPKNKATWPEFTQTWLLAESVTTAALAQSRWAVGTVGGRIYVMSEAGSRIR